MFFELITLSLKLLRKPYNHWRYIKNTKDNSSLKVTADENITKYQFCLLSGRKNEKIVRLLNVSQSLDALQLRTWSSAIWINDTFLNCFSSIWAHSVPSQFGIPVSKTIWIRHWERKLLTEIQIFIQSDFSKRMWSHLFYIYLNVDSEEIRC